jgi:hypothetical protein
MKRYDWAAAFCLHLVRLISLSYRAHRTDSQLIHTNPFYPLGTYLPTPRNGAISSPTNAPTSPSSVSAAGQNDGVARELFPSSSSSTSSLPPAAPPSAANQAPAPSRRLLQTALRTRFALIEHGLAYVDRHSSTLTRFMDVCVVVVACFFAFALLCFAESLVLAVMRCVCR